jgi:AcrR family transcriptional regulator
VPSTSTSAPARRTQVERRAEAEQGLIDAALRLFAGKGIDQTSLADIGEEAGYSRGLVNHHFGSKAALVERLAEERQRRFDDIVASLDEKHELEAIVAIAESYLRAVSTAPDDLRAFFVMWGAALPDDAALRSFFVADDRRVRAGIEQLVIAGGARGTINETVNPAGFAAAFLGLLRGTAAQFLIDRTDVDLAGARATCEHMVRATLTPTASRRRR